MKTMNSYFRIAILLCLSFLPVLAMGQTVVDSWQPTADTAPESRAILLMDPPQSGVVHRLALPPVAREDIEALIQRNERQKRTEVGLGRAVPDPMRTVSMGDLYWREGPDGQQVTNMVVESAEARALRVAVDVDSLPAGVVIRFHPEGDTSTVFGPYDRSRMAELARFSKEGTYWSPIVEGQSLAMEVAMPASADVRGLDLELPRVSHLVTSVRDRFSLKDLGSIGNSGACNVDLRCESDSSWHSVGDSVAKYAFTTQSGSTGLCTGTLLADEQQTGTPYFLSANHCLSSSTLAATVNTYWFFERESCGGPDPTSVNQQSGGAQLVETGEGTDYTLMELNDTPPAGAIYAGWTTASPGVGSETTGIHHPSGDLKKISFGTVDGYSSYLGSENNSDANYIRMLWTISGTTEGGSSGSALFNPSRQVVGTLTGGYAGCSGSQDNGEPDWYGRFDYTHACISDEIGGSPVADCPDESDGGGGGGDAGSLSSGVSESGSVSAGEWVYYTIDVPSGASRLLVELAGLSADGDLYVRSGSQPTESNFDCRSWDVGTTDEICDISSPSDGTWNVGIYGYEATSYTVTATVSDGGGDGDGDGGDGGGGGSSGGCALADSNSQDPVLLLLILMALTGLMSSRGRSRRRTRLD